MSKADTCRVLITPALQKAGWGDPVWHMADQHYFTDWHIVLVGDGHKRQARKARRPIICCAMRNPSRLLLLKPRPKSSDPVRDSSRPRITPKSSACLSPTRPMVTASRNGTSRTTHSVALTYTPRRRKELLQCLCETPLQSALVSVYSVGTSRLTEGKNADVDAP